MLLHNLLSDISQVRLDIYTWSILITCIVSSSRISTLLISPVGLKHGVYPGDDKRIEWDINDKIPIDGHLVFHYEDMELFTVHFILDDFTLTEAGTGNRQFYFSNPRTNRFGVALRDVGLSEAGIYSCSYKYTINGTDVTHSEIILLVYEPPDKPVIIPDGPIMIGNDVTLTCKTSSNSEPSLHRPSMEITWYQDGVMLQLQSVVPYTGIVMTGKNLTLTNLDLSNKIHDYRCTAQEAGSKYAPDSHLFPILLYTLIPITRDITDAIDGNDVILEWRLSPESDVTLYYNRSISYLNNGRYKASYNLRYYHWQSNSGRLAYHSPFAGIYGLKVQHMQPSDMGYYTCVYRDEYGTLITSAPISLVLAGHEMPTTQMTTERMVGSSQSGQTYTETPYTLGNTDRASLTPQHVIILSTVIGVLAVVIIVAVIIIVIRKRRKKSEPKNLLKRSEEPAQVSMRYRRTESMTSVYSTLRESLMVGDDVIIQNQGPKAQTQGPSLPPPREEENNTYNEPFEDTYLTPIDSHNVKANTYCNNDVNDGTVMCNNDDKDVTVTCNNNSSRQRAEDNVYLAPISAKTK